MLDTANPNGSTTAEPLSQAGGASRKVYSRNGVKQWTERRKEQSVRGKPAPEEKEVLP